MDHEAQKHGQNETGKETHRVVLSFEPKRLVKAFLKISAFSLLLAYILFHFDSWKQVGNVVLNAITPILLGFVLAFVLNAFLNLFENFIFGRLTRGNSKVWKAIKRPLCLVLTYMVVIALFLFVSLYILPEVFKSLERITDTARVNLPIYAAAVTRWVENVARNLNLDTTTILDTIKNFNWISLITGMTDITSSLISHLINATMNIASGVATFVISVIFSAYFLACKESLALSVKRAAYGALPKKIVATVEDITVTANHLFSSFVRGQLTECIILGCLCFIGMSLIGFEYALLISSIVTVSSLIPLMGAYIGCFVGAFLLLLIHPLDALLFILFFICLQQFEGNLIYPKVVGSTIGLPGVYVLVAVVVFSNLWGVFGIILGTPLTAVLYAILRRIVSNRLFEKNLTDEDLEVGKYPYLSESALSSHQSGRPLSNHVVEQSVRHPANTEKKKKSLLKIRKK